MRHLLAVIATVLLGMALPAVAQVKIGVVVSATGPAASLGIPERNAITLAPRLMAKSSIDYIVLDDASDPTNARRSIDRLTSEDHVDLLIGSSTSPSSLAMVEVAGQSKTPMISMGAARAIIFPMDANRRWVFKTPYNDATTAAATVKDMQARGVKTVGILAFNDAYGEGWSKEFRPLAEKSGINVVASEQYSPRDTSVTAQALKVVAANPDAVLVVASGTPGALPPTALAERGYKGKVYQTTGVVNADFLRVGGAAVEGTLIAADPLSVASQLPDANPAKQEAQSFTHEYDAKFGTGSTSAFSGYAWDAVLIAQAAITQAQGKGQPGTEAFRSALRDQIEGLKGVPTTAGPVTMNPEDHNGYAPDAPVMITVLNGKFALAK